MTLRGLGKELESYLLHVAAEENLSMNQAAIRVLKRGAGLAERRGRSEKIGSALDEFAGTWSASKAKALLASMEHFESIDKELWR